MSILTAFLLFLLAFVVIGVLSFISNRHTNIDYLLASHSIKPWLVALSAIATNNSGYMFVGLMGVTYATGLHSMWYMVGWIAGDFIMSLLIHKKLRITTETTGTHSFGGALSKWGHSEYKKLRMVIGFITVLFLGIYAAAQLSAGSKALHVLFGWDYSAGAIIGAVIVVLYCMVGGIRASIWTDAAQSFVMVFAMALMFYITVSTVGGWGSFVSELNQVSSNYMDLFPQMEIGGGLGIILFIAGWTFAGIGVIGQPHIMVRFMAMDTPKNINRVRIYYYGWYILFTFLAVSVALSARIILPESEGFDPELALPKMAMELLPDALVGLVLAGMFAATMSTADSQILSCTAAISRDFGIEKLRSYWATKVATLLVTAIALIVALTGSDSVFILVMLAWGVLGCAFGPLMIVYAFGQKPSEALAILMLITGVITIIVWPELGGDKYIAEFAPGFIFPLVVFCIGKLSGQVQKLKKIKRG